MERIDQESVRSFKGSTVFLGLSKASNVPLDQINYVFSQVTLLILATLLRTYFHPAKTKPSTRHWFELVVSFTVCFFCFGLHSIHMILLPLICFLILLKTDPAIMQSITLAISLGYLSILHLYRQIYEYGTTDVDITGPIMVITQKVSSLAYHLHDGLTKNELDMTENQKKYAVYYKPNILEYFSYCLTFQTLTAGPGISYKEYSSFIEGTSKKALATPSPTRIVLRKLLVAVCCGFFYVLLVSRFPITRLKEDAFIEDTSLSYKFWYMYLSTGTVRLKYYFAWVFADAICNNSGLGFNGFDSDGNPDWNMMSNVNIIKFETGTNLRETIEAWNLRTNQWLRSIVYDRATKYQVLLTYGLSALWHGFYPGYYLTFANGALFTLASRIGRRHVRTYFLKTPELKAFYDVLTFCATRLVITYIAFTFVLLEFAPCIRLFMSMFWCLHLIAVAMIVLVPLVLPKPNPSHLNVNHIENTLRQVGPITNSIL